MLGKILIYLKGSHFFRVGLPMISLCLIGTHGLKFYQEIRYEEKESRQRILTGKEMINLTKSNRKQLSLESEYERMMKKVDLTTYKNKRVPRPWKE
ncbi:Cytochrome c oxidase assembly protein COX16-like protein, mitochondrial-like [Oopsacas minuta]|uniref:Cytochrome c oxidase assembly protein COX16 homolog, mitochondrial n=1 Tax=Oopsacas minuta TaxID=111878 RepID=A0AAV7JE08_9METZ|nr:Cytochrome c oxidase assembly protein COX16-like protein, mitochondrial-like [Oopsacas minuta]